MLGIWTFGLATVGVCNSMQMSNLLLSLIKFLAKRIY